MGKYFLQKRQNVENESQWIAFQYVRIYDIEKSQEKAGSAADLLLTELFVTVLIKVS